MNCVDQITPKLLQLFVVFSFYIFASNVAALADINSFSASPTSGVAPLNVSFSGSGNSIHIDCGNGGKLELDFGDGTSTETAIQGLPVSISASHTYSSPGTYSATLQLNCFGTIDGTSSLTINVTPPCAAPPSAEIFSVSPSAPRLVGTTVTVAGRSINPSGCTTHFKSWEIKSSPPGSTSTLSSSGGDLTTFNPDVGGDYLVRYTARNEVAETFDEETITVVVPVPVGGRLTATQFHCVGTHMGDKAFQTSLNDLLPPGIASSVDTIRLVGSSGETDAEAISRLDRLGFFVTIPIVGAGGHVFVSSLNPASVSMIANEIFTFEILDSSGSIIASLDLNLIIEDCGPVVTGRVVLCAGIPLDTLIIDLVHHGLPSDVSIRLARFDPLSYAGPALFNDIGLEYTFGTSPRSATGDGLRGSPTTGEILVRANLWEEVGGEFRMFGVTELVFIVEDCSSHTDIEIEACVGQHILLDLLDNPAIPLQVRENAFEVLASSQVEHVEMGMMRPPADVGMDIGRSGKAFPNNFEWRPTDPGTYMVRASVISDVDSIKEIWITIRVEGCLIMDTDGDGITDPSDSSPISPEDFDGVDDEDGIPEFTIQLPNAKVGEFYDFSLLDLDQQLSEILIALSQEYPELNVGYRLIEGEVPRGLLEGIVTPSMITGILTPSMTTDLSKIVAPTELVGIVTPSMSVGIVRPNCFVRGVPTVPGDYRFIVEVTGSTLAIIELLLTIEDSRAIALPCDPEDDPNPESSETSISFSCMEARPGASPSCDVETTTSDESGESDTRMSELSLNTGSGYVYREDGIDRIIATGTVAYGCGAPTLTERAVFEAGVAVELIQQCGILEGREPTSITKVSDDGTTTQLVLIDSTGQRINRLLEPRERLTQMRMVYEGTVDSGSAEPTQRDVTINISWSCYNGDGANDCTYVIEELLCDDISTGENCNVQRQEIEGEGCATPGGSLTASGLLPFCQNSTTDLKRCPIEEGISSLRSAPILSPIELGLMTQEPDDETGFVAEPRSIVFNEVAWAGTLSGPNNEYIELINNTEEDINLDGWRIISDVDSIVIELSGTIPANGYYLLERDSDDVVSDIEADLIYEGELVDDGMTLVLIDPEENIIDTVNSDGGEWPAGGRSGFFLFTMERYDSTISGDDDNWASNDLMTMNGSDSAGNPIFGTPAAENSVSRAMPPMDEALPLQVAVALLGVMGVVTTIVLRRLA
jgi:PKD repeat protein